mmetsp:Transcript_36929/g.54062  ORF Transcript_36929/g.54062 Transcript_36929/m.54062 type:complete len:112 (-) Transcript_36929:83-418(-)
MTTAEMSQKERLGLLRRKTEFGSPQEDAPQEARKAKARKAAASMLLVKKGNDQNQKLFARIVSSRSSTDPALLPTKKRRNIHHHAVSHFEPSKLPTKLPTPNSDDAPDVYL